MKRELFREGVAVVDGVPTTRMKLSLFLRHHNHRDPVDCGTIACAAGWMCLYPKFQKKGLYLNENTLPAYKDEVGYAAMAAFFQIPLKDAQELFGPRGSSIYDRRITKEMTDKQVFWNRAVKYLENHQ